jgi:DNA-binding GntR family transcriptional regulator
VNTVELRDLAPKTHNLVSLPAKEDYVAQVYRALLDAICDGTLPPQTRLTQDEIAERLGVSRSPVQQALRLLAKDGFVRDAPGRGVLVAPLDADWIGKVYQVRGALDALAARLAAERGAKIDPELLRLGRRATTSGNVRAMIDADIAFHAAIYQASGNELIAKSAYLHWDHLRRVMGAVLQASTVRTAIWDEHAAIANAIGKRDAERAAALCEGHSAKARSNLVRNINAMLDEQAAAAG